MISSMALAGAAVVATVDAQQGSQPRQLVEERYRSGRRWRRRRSREAESLRLHPQRKQSMPEGGRQRQARKDASRSDWRPAVVPGGLRHRGGRKLRLPRQSGRPPVRRLRTLRGFHRGRRHSQPTDRGDLQPVRPGQKRSETRHFEERKQKKETEIELQEAKNREETQKAKELEEKVAKEKEAESKRDQYRGLCRPRRHHAQRQRATSGLASAPTATWSPPETPASAATSATASAKPGPKAATPHSAAATSHRRQRRPCRRSAVSFRSDIATNNSDFRLVKCTQTTG